MNSYLICPVDGAYFNLVNQFVLSQGGGRGRKTRYQDPPLRIDSRRAFEENTFKELFRNPTDTDTVFIVPELHWDDDVSVNAGYEVALDLLTDTGKLARDFFVNIIFVSLYTQDQLSELVSLDYAEMVRTFPHITLFDLMEGKQSVYVPAYSKIHFELMKRVVVSKSGKLDFIKHKLAHFTNFSTDTESELEAGVNNAKEGIRKVLDTLSLSSMGGDGQDQARRIEAYVRQADMAKTKDDVSNLVAVLRQFIDETKVRISPGSDCPINTSNDEYKVLIVEDDEFFRQKLSAFFEKLLGPGTIVKSYTNAEIAGISPDKNGKSDSALTRIRKEAGKYNIVIFDMMYTMSGREDDIALPFNGFDLYESLRDAEAKSRKRRAAVRIVTALPRNDISRLVKKHFVSETPVVFTKGNGWEQLEGCLRDRMDEILKECKKNADSYTDIIPYYPKCGVFRYSGVSDAIASHKAQYEEAFKYAADVAEGKIKMSDCALTAKHDPSEVISHLKSILANRRLVIKFLMSDSAPRLTAWHADKDKDIFDEDLYREFLKDYVDDSFPIDNGFGKGYLQTKLGFELEKGYDRQRDVNDGQLSRKEKESCFRCVIDLKNELNFFKGELDLPEMQADSMELDYYMDYVSTVLERMKKECPYRHINITETYRDLKIDAFLSSKKKTVDSLMTMLSSIYRYISDDRLDESPRKDLYDIFDNYFNLDDKPDKKDRLKRCSREVVSMFDKIVKYEFE